MCGQEETQRKFQLLLLAFKKFPLLLLTFEKFPHLLLSFEKFPLLLLAFEKFPLLLLAFEKFPFCSSLLKIFPISTFPIFSTSNSPFEFLFLSRMKKPYMQQIRLFTTNSDFISKTTISRNEFIERRSKLHSILLESISVKSEGNVFALLLSRRKTFSAPDVPHIYRQCSHFRYLCGINNPNSRLLIGPENQCVLFTENQSEHQILWEGRAQSSQEIHRISGIDQLLPMHEFEKYLIETVRDAHLAVDLPTLREFGTNEFDLKKIYQMLCQGGFNHISLNDKIDQLRWIKSKSEQELMKESSRIGSETINAIIRESNGFKNESQIVGFLEYHCRLRGANYLAYPPVVASGANANTIHYISSNMKLNPGDCVLVDAGCDVGGYVSDITRCFPITGSFTTAQKTLYDVLNHIQDQLLRYVKNRRPLRLNELYLFMLECMADALESIIFFKKNLGREELIKECDKLCPHHVSHYLGMDVHDTPSISRAIDCKPGVVITVEPGIYVRKENTAIREEFKGIGFRIEDDVLLNDTNAEILTNQCIRNSGEIEYSMRI